MESFWMTTALTGAMAITNVGGSIFLKLSASPNKQEFFVAGALAYVIGAAIYVALLREQSIAVLAVVSTMLQLGLMISLSVWLFDERLNVIQGVAMAVAVLSAGVAMLAATH